VEGLLLRPRAGVSRPRWPRAQPLVTARLALEPLRPEHARELAPMLDDPALHAFTGGAPETEDALRARFTRQAAGTSPDESQGWLNWVARDQRTHAPVGLIQATVSGAPGARTAALAWLVATDRQGEGLATEAATAAQRWLREQGVERFVADIHPEHAASDAVARRLGLHPTDERRGGEIRWSSA
jgi:RimJ/RimL family protein N-acetyltransferase